MSKTERPEGTLGMGKVAAGRRGAGAMGAPVAASLGERVRAYVQDRIDSGEWPEGARIPSEAKLVEILGASRMTVHIALRDLAAEGVLSRRQGAGTFVQPRGQQSTFLELRNIHSEIEARGHGYLADFDLTRARFAIRVRGRRRAISLSVSPEEDALRGDTHDPLATAWLDAVRLTTHRIFEEVLANN